MKIRMHHHALISNHLIFETSIKHVIMPQNIYYKNKIYQIWLFWHSIHLYQNLLHSH